MANYIREQFPDRKHTIDLLMAENPDFLEICEDYDACVNALQHWTKSKEPEAIQNDINHCAYLHSVLQA